MTDSVSKVIPQPKPYPLLGNAPEIDREAFIQSMMQLAREYGPIFRLQLPSDEFIIVSSQELVNELCDEKRFDKKLSGPLIHQRDNAGDGLFTSKTQEPNWGRAHRILMPAFGPASIKNMFDPMWDIAEQLLLKWERTAVQERIDVADDMTRLTLDTIALCAFGYRFNSFYTKEQHPYVSAMVRLLKQSGERASRPALMTRLMVFEARQRDEDIRFMHQIANEVIAQRKAVGYNPEGKDLLDLMLSGKDPETGEGLSDENIGFQMVTFLTAGHETTSGLLSFALYGLLENPDILMKAHAEVARVLGNDGPRFEHLAQLTYIDQVLKETLRLWPTAPVFALYPYEEETTIGGGYTVRNDQTIIVLIPMLHRDPKVWGDDAERFDPDRFAPESFAKLPTNAWKPFGNGQRACIGRPFAMQEAILVLASVLQRFELSKADPGYQLRIKETLTLKPEGFFIKAKRRDIIIEREAKSLAHESLATVKSVEQRRGETANRIPIRVLYGSNSGSSEAFAQRIATDAKVKGYGSSIDRLDTAVENLPREGAVVIVTASYEGKPTDDARQFVEWLDGLAQNSLQGVKYAVFGCGNKDWTRTYQAIPQRIDQKMHDTGAERLVERGAADARGDFFGDFDRWYDSFWPLIDAAFGRKTPQAMPNPQWELEFVEGARDPILRQNNLQRGMVVENRELVDTSSPLGRSKRHIEIVLPTGASYRAGDYLSVLPENPPDSIDRALRRFGLAYDAQVILRSAPGIQTFFPTGQPVMAGELLTSYVELGMAASRQHIQKLVASATNPIEATALERLATNEAVYTIEVLEKRVSVLELLERFVSCNLPFAVFLQMLSPLKPRQYSISSTPLWNKQNCTITVAVVEAPAWSGQGTFRGVASSYLAQARPGMKIAVTTRPSQAGFHPPESLATPIIMVAAGTGLAPFRGFIQERALRVAEGVTPGEALLFFGCDHPDIDFLYKDELARWEEKGIVKVHPAFFKAPNGEITFVQHRLWHDRAEVMALIGKGARIYVCGDGKHMAPAVRDTFGRMYQEFSGGTEDQVEAWLSDLEKSIRYTQDVFS
jgi:cytochrome P450 / NADPH-cytochrome P450 reductase